MTTAGSDWFGDETATFGDRLAGAREASGMSRKQLAERLGVRIRTIRAWEDDVLEPRSSRLLGLSGVLNVSIMWLLNGEGDGLEAPPEDLPEDLPGIAEFGEILTGVRDLHERMAQNAERLGVLEKRLRIALKGTDGC